MKNQLKLDNFILNYLFVFAVFGMGIGINGRFIIDEIYIFFFRLYLVIILFFKSNLIIKFKIDFLLLFLFFFLIKSLISIIILIQQNQFFLDNLPLFFSKLRYLILYSCIIIIYSIKNFYINKNFQTLIILLFIFFTFAQGFLLENLDRYFDIFENIKFDRWESQGQWWSGSSYFAVPVIYLIFLSLYNSKIISLLIFILCLLFSLYFYSRFIFLFLLFFSFLYVFCYFKINKLFYNFKKNIFYVLISCAIILILFFLEIEQIKYNFSTYQNLFYGTLKSDISRLSDLLVSYEILNSKTNLLFFFGDDWMSHKTALARFLNLDKSEYRTSSIASLIHDGGILGFLLFALMIIELFLRNVKYIPGSLFIKITTAFFYCFFILFSTGVTFLWESVFFFLILNPFKFTKFV